MKEYSVKIEKKTITTSIQFIQIMRYIIDNVKNNSYRSHTYYFVQLKYWRNYIVKRRTQTK